MAVKRQGRGWGRQGEAGKLWRHGGRGKGEKEADSREEGLAETDSERWAEHGGEEATRGETKIVWRERERNGTRAPGDRLGR